MGFHLTRTGKFNARLKKAFKSRGMEQLYQKVSREQVKNFVHYGISGDELAIYLIAKSNGLDIVGDGDIIDLHSNNIYGRHAFNLSKYPEFNTCEALLNAEKDLAPLGDIIEYLDIDSGLTRADIKNLYSREILSSKLYNYSKAVDILGLKPSATLICNLYDNGLTDPFDITYLEEFSDDVKTMLRIAKVLDIAGLSPSDLTNVHQGSEIAKSLEDLVTTLAFCKANKWKYVPYDFGDDVSFDDIVFGYKNCVDPVEGWVNLFGSFKTARPIIEACIDLSRATEYHNSGLSPSEMIFSHKAGARPGLLAGAKAALEAQRKLTGSKKPVTLYNMLDLLKIPYKSPEFDADWDGAIPLTPPTAKIIWPDDEDDKVWENDGPVKKRTTPPPKVVEREPKVNDERLDDIFNGLDDSDTKTVKKPVVKQRVMKPIPYEKDVLPPEKDVLRAIMKKYSSKPAETSSEANIPLFDEFIVEEL